MRQLMRNLMRRLKRQGMRKEVIQCLEEIEEDLQEWVR
jgi:hypothetical protein